MSDTTSKSRANDQQKVPSGKLVLILAVVVAGIAVIAAGLFLALRDTTDQIAVDRALSELEAATLISNENSDLASEIVDLSPQDGKEASEETPTSMGELSELRPLGALGASKNLTEAAESSRTAARQLKEFDRVLNRSENLREGATADQAGLLERTSNQLVARLEGVGIGQLLARSSERIEAALNRAIATLENENALSDENQRQIAKVKASLSAMARSAGSLNDSVDRILSTQARSLDRKRNEVLTVTGPYECGFNSDGNAVVINEGSATCEEAIRVSFRASSGSRPAEGWVCDITATTLDGFTLDGASGRFCLNESRGTRVSVFNPDAAAAAAEQTRESDSSEGRCGPGEDWIGVYGVPGSERCIAIEADETER